MSGGWSWSFVPQRLMHVEAFLELSAADRGLLLSLYMRCDRWGRGPGGGRALAALVGLDRTVVQEGLGRLLASGLVEAVGGDWALPRYDEDAAPAGVIRRRVAPSEFGGVAAAPVVAGTVPESPGEAGSEPEVPGDAGLHARVVSSRLVSSPEADAGARGQVPMSPPAVGEVFRSIPERLAAESWVRGLHAHGHPMSAHALVTSEAVALVASGHPEEVFVAAVARAVTAGATWGGWRAKYPLTWLGKECEIAARPAVKPGRQRAAVPDVPVEAVSAWEAEQNARAAARQGAAVAS